MEISIEYCGTCNYRPIAAALSVLIKKELGLSAVLINSRQMGAFEIRADNDIIYSKIESGFFPDNNLIIEALRKRKESG